MKGTRCLTRLCAVGIVFCGFMFSNLCSGQKSLNSLEKSFFLNRHRLAFVSTATGVGYAATMIGLNELWYKDYPRSKFHFFNDNAEWLQMDKAGHALTAYHLGYMGYEMLQWSGLSGKQSLWIGGNLGLFFLTSMEVFDGFSKEWGFSPGDMVANVAGTALFISQQAIWNKQMVALKFSSWQSDVSHYRPEILGRSVVQKILKDYNAQTVWVSANPAAMMRNSDGFPKWLNIAFGYSGNNMLGGDEVPEFNAQGQPLPELQRYRQYILSVDVDLYGIKTKSAFWNTVIHTFGFLKIPAPALEFSQGTVKGHWLYF